MTHSAKFRAPFARRKLTAPVWALALGLVSGAALPVAGVAALAAFAPSAASGQPVQLRFEKLNRPYSDFVEQLAPIGEEGMSVQLASPKQTLILRDHRIRLTPVSGATDGTFMGELELDIQGKGALVADVTMGPIVQKLSDEIIVPPQTLRLAAKVRIRRVADGYEITPDKLPERIEVAVQSRTINQILILCDQAATLSLGAVDCDGLDRSLTRPAVPIPGGAQTYLLADENLTDADRARIDALIGPASPAAPANP
jgi:hypothetical protein